jgi:hypothetical protein
LEDDEKEEDKAVKRKPGDRGNGGDAEPALGKDTEEEKEERDFGEDLG